MNPLLETSIIMSTLKSKGAKKFAVFLELTIVEDGVFLKDILNLDRQQRGRKWYISSHNKINASES